MSEAALELAIDHLYQRLRAINPAVPPPGSTGEGPIREALRIFAYALPQSQCSTCHARLSDCASCQAKKLARVALKKATPALKDAAVKHGPSLVMWLGDKLQEFTKEEPRDGSKAGP